MVARSSLRDSVRLSKRSRCPELYRGKLHRIAVLTFTATKCAHRAADRACFEIYPLIKEYHETIAIPVGRWAMDKQEKCFKNIQFSNYIATEMDLLSEKYLRCLEWDLHCYIAIGILKRIIYKGLSKQWRRTRTSYRLFNIGKEVCEDVHKCYHGCIWRDQYSSDWKPSTYSPVTEFVSRVINRTRFSRTNVERVDFSFRSCVSFQNAMSPTDWVITWYDTPSKP